jgi:hypothetical protein
LRLAAALAFLMLAGCAAAPDPSIPPELSAKAEAADAAFRAAPVISSFLVQGVAIDGQLYLRDDARHLVALDLQKGTLRGIHAAGVVDIAREGDRLLVLRALDPLPLERSDDPPPAIVRYELAEVRGGQNNVLAAFAVRTKREANLTLFVSGAEPGVVSTSRVRMWSSGQLREVPIRRDATFGSSVAAASRDGRSLYIGNNRGEWGGGLERIEIATGKVTNVESILDPKEICGEPLDADCDPVNAVVADPKRADCVLAGVGLQHMFSVSGRVLRVCGDKVEVVFEPKPPPPPPREPGPDGFVRTLLDDFSDAEAVYGLKTSGEDIWVVTNGSIRRLKPSGDERIEMPRFEQVAGVTLSRELPGMILLSTQLNQRLAVSGATPLLVPLD